MHAMVITITFLLVALSVLALYLIVKHVVENPLENTPMPR